MKKLILVPIIALSYTFATDLEQAYKQNSYTKTIEKLKNKKETKFKSFERIFKKDVLRG
jgi:hypothetical protein